MSIRFSFLKNPILSGTLLLTLAGFLSRIIGFFYRIFLSQQIGAEGMGVYQLIFPVFSVCFSLCCGPIQTAISRHVAVWHVGRKATHSSPKVVLCSGLLLSFFLACLCTVILYTASPRIARTILMEPRCADLLQLMSLTIPICSLHCCISGYYYGLQKASVPALAQLAEQIVRVISVFVICSAMITHGKTPDASTAVFGMICGELASLAVSVTALFLCRLWRSIAISRHHKASTGASAARIHRNTFSALPQIVSLAAPLAVTRLCVSLLQSLESVMIPGRLQVYGMTAREALSVYGVLTGMAYPFVLFPTAAIQSLSVMLLPNMARSQSVGDRERINITTTRTITCCLYLGILCTGLFLFYGRDLGQQLFSNVLAGSYIVTLSWLCPFLYLSITLGSILNGLGKTKAVFFHNILSLASQLLFVLLLIPRIGIRGYLYGLLFGQLLLTVLHLMCLKKLVCIQYLATHHLLRPICALLISAFLAKKITGIFLTPVISQPLPVLCISCAAFVFFYFCFLLAGRKKR